MRRGPKPYQHCLRLQTQGAGDVSLASWHNLRVTALVIDTDTASDDAVALIMVVRHPGTEVLGITTVAGNCGVAQATRNALYTVELCDVDVPVHRGCDRPLLVESRYATWFYGGDGLGDRGYPPRPGRVRAPRMRSRP